MSDQPADSVSQQVTSTTPTKKLAKNPKRVAAGKAVAERTRLAREAQKKAAAEATVIIANNKAKETQGDSPSQPHDVEDTNQQNVLTTTQWLSVVSILISVIGLYYKREEIKRAFNPQTSPPPSQPLLEATPSERPPPPQPRKGIRGMD